MISIYVIIIYNSSQVSQALQNELYKSEDIFAKNASIHGAQLCWAPVNTVMLFSGTKPQSLSDYARIVELTSQWQLIFIKTQWIIWASSEEGPLNEEVRPQE